MPLVTEIPEGFTVDPADSIVPLPREEVVSHVEAIIAQMGEQVTTEQAAALREVAEKADRIAAGACAVTDGSGSACGCPLVQAGLWSDPIGGPEVFGFYTTWDRELTADTADILIVEVTG